MNLQEKENKIAFMSYIEVVLMRKGSTHFNLVLTKLQSIYNCGIFECLDNPEYLKTVLKEVYPKDYNSVLDDIGVKSESLVDMDEFNAKFFKVMES